MWFLKTSSARSETRKYARIGLSFNPGISVLFRGSVDSVIHVDAEKSHGRGQSVGTAA
jgi:hypothetical protein